MVARTSRCIGLAQEQRGWPQPLCHSHQPPQPLVMLPLLSTMAWFTFWHLWRAEARQHGRARLAVRRTAQAQAVGRRLVGRRPPASRSLCAAGAGVSHGLHILEVGTVVVCSSRISMQRAAW